jgi:uncharacterized protein YbbK (DUF523 family)
MKTTSHANAKIRLGISACLLGQKVRYDGGHKLDRVLRDGLGRLVQYVPVCPECECGLGVPREAMRLVGNARRPRLVTIRTGRDLTGRMERWARSRAAQLEKEDLCGFIFKSGSPSCGMERVKLYGGRGRPPRAATGIFARIFMERFPLLPVEDEGRLHDPALRKRFIERAVALKRWREAQAAERTRAALARFHAAHKQFFLSRSPRVLHEADRLVAEAKKLAPSALWRRYGELLMAALKNPAAAGKHSHRSRRQAGIASSAARTAASSNRISRDSRGNHMTVHG